MGGHVEKTPQRMLSNVRSRSAGALLGNHAGPNDDDQEDWTLLRLVKPGRFLVLYSSSRNFKVFRVLGLSLFSGTGLHFMFRLLSLKILASKAPVIQAAPTIQRKPKATINVTSWERPSTLCKIRSCCSIGILNFSTGSTDFKHAHFSTLCRIRGPDP